MCKSKEVRIDGILTDRRVAGRVRGDGVVREEAEGVHSEGPSQDYGPYMKSCREVLKGLKQRDEIKSVLQRNI